MTGNSPASGASGAGTATWLDEQSALLRGVAHALSNRVGTLVAATGLITPGGTVSPTIAGVLQSEGERLEGVLHLVRLLSGTGDPDADALEPIYLPDLVTPVVELHAHHPALRDVPVDVVPDPQAPPVRAKHGGLTRALLVLLSAVKEGASAATLRWTGEGAQVAVAVDGAPGTAATAAAASELLGMPVEATPTGYVARIPRV